MIKENLTEVEQRIGQACNRAGRKREEVTLIAVSKTQPAAFIREAAAEGISHFGENKVQELCRKYTEFAKENDNLHWHMIGHLQRNKVKDVVGKTVLIHSVDSLRLAEAIDQEAKKRNIVCKILIEVNSSGENSKYGIAFEQTESLIREISHLSSIKVHGLMTVAPYTEHFEENRIFFRKMSKLCVDIMTKNIDNVVMDTLSMGMTGDYEVAVEEGATIIRIGTGIFGLRSYQ